MSNILTIQVYRKLFLAIEMGNYPVFKPFVRNNEFVAIKQESPK
jgi:hypothetical protein